MSNKREIYLSNQVDHLNEVIDQLVEAGTSVLVTLAMDHADHREVQKLAKAIKAAQRRKN